MHYGLRWVLMGVALAVAGCGGSGGGGEGDGGTDASEDTTCTEAADCDDGVFCNGAELCEPEAEDADAQGCVPPREPRCAAGQACDEEMQRCTADCGLNPDSDGDGHDAVDCGGDDCDDSDANRYPGNVEVCDTANHDEDCDPTTFGVRDLDGDGFPDASCCNVDEEGETICGDDCDDQRGVINPTATEACDGFDNDCDGEIDEGVQTTFYEDVDGDGWGTDDSTMEACNPPDGYVAMGGDCQDADAPGINPGRPDACGGDDNDCDGEVDAPDDDGDGYGRSECGGQDCDDDDGTVNPGATEVAGDEVDQNCDGNELCFRDSDGDGDGNRTATTVSTDLDCDDEGEAGKDDDYDCCDTDADAKFGQTMWFTERNNCGSWDYDCHSGVERRYTNHHQCRIDDSGRFCESTQGWIPFDEPIPPCGETGQYIETCNIDHDMRLCTSGPQETRTQECR